ncbi:MAG: tyrosine-type recombinase/integrase [Ilumatobacteraceae bacterium]
MSALAQAAGDYLAVRRALGYKLEADGRLLEMFVADLDAQGIDVVTVAAAVAWAANTARGGNGAGRLTTIRCFTRYLQALDPAHQVPPIGILPARRTRPVPHLYTDTEIAALLDAARQLDPPLRAATVETVIGLLSVTGMRVGEVLRLNTVDVDVDAGVLTVWLSKFGKSRHVPITPSTVVALDRYLEIRRRLAQTTTTNALFVDVAGTRLAYPALLATFHDMVDISEISTGSAPPRIHGFRHSFAVRTLLGWYRDGADVQALLPRLSTYLGHVAPSSTYWYLSASPELMAIAADRLDQNREAHK